MVYQTGITGKGYYALNSPIHITSSPSQRFSDVWQHKVCTWIRCLLWISGIWKGQTRVMRLADRWFTAYLLLYKTQRLWLIFSNATLDAVIVPLNVAANYVDSISKGNIPEKITDEYYGDFNNIKENLNYFIKKSYHAKEINGDRYLSISKQTDPEVIKKLSTAMQELKK